MNKTSLEHILAVIRASITFKEVLMRQEKSVLILTHGAVLSANDEALIKQKVIAEEIVEASSDKDAMRIAHQFVDEKGFKTAVILIGKGKAKVLGKKDQTVSVSYTKSEYVYELIWTMNFALKNITAFFAIFNGSVVIDDKFRDFVNNLQSNVLQAVQLKLAA